MSRLPPGQVRLPSSADYILEAADDIAYQTADIEDAFVKGFISYHDLEKELEGLQSSFTDLSFDALGKLRTLYERGKRSRQIIQRPMR